MRYNTSLVIHVYIKTLIFINKNINPLTSRPGCMPGSRYTGVGVLFFVHLKLELLTQFPASNDEKYINVVYIWRKFVSFYGYVHWRMTTEISVMYGSEKVNKMEWKLPDMTIYQDPLQKWIQQKWYEVTNNRIETTPDVVTMLAQHWTNIVPALCQHVTTGCLTAHSSRDSS